MNSSAWSVPSILVLVLMLLGPALAHQHLVAPIAGFLTFAVALIPGLIALFYGLLRLYRGDRRRGLSSALIGALPVIVVATALVNGRDIPPINDISTNLDNPPPLTTAASAAENQGKDLAYPEEFKGKVQASYPDLISLQVHLPPDQAYAVVKKLSERSATWTLTREDPAALTIEGSDTDGLFQFTDDFAIRVLPLAGGAQIDMRSRSRVGKGDMGANAKRIRRFFAAVQDSLNPSAASNAAEVQ